MRLALAVVAAAALLVAAPASAALPKLVGTVGPGFTITLKRNGVKVKTLKAGKYTLTVSDKSKIHNYFLKGPGISKQITGVAFVGTKTVTVTLKRGKYTYVCTPHAATMKGTFSVT